MKKNELASLAALAIGLAVGFGLWFLTPELHWGVHVAAGVGTGAALFGAADTLAKGEKIKPANLAAFVGSALGLAAGIGTYYALEGAHWSVPVIVGLVVAGGYQGADLSHRALKKTAGDD